MLVPQLPVAWTLSFIGKTLKTETGPCPQVSVPAQFHPSAASPFGAVCRVCLSPTTEAAYTGAMIADRQPPPPFGAIPDRPLERPYVVGIAGGTGSGKTTVAESLERALPRSRVVRIQHDSYYRHRPELSPSERECINFDHPDALDNKLLIEHLDALRAGHPVLLPVYDFRLHLRSQETVPAEPAPVLLVEGILTLVDPDLRERLDLKLFVDTDADIRILRRIERDIAARGRSFEQVREQYFRTVRPMHLQFVEPSKRYADVILPEGGNNAIAIDMVLAKLRAVLGTHSSPPPPLASRQ